VGAAPQNIPAGAAAAAQAFTFSFAPAAGRHVLFAQATCVDDRANGDPPPSPIPLVDLAANDNNLGVRVVRI
jgi:hypothetical protein